MLAFYENGYAAFDAVKYERPADALDKLVYRRITT